MRNAIELTSGTKCSAMRIQRQVKRSTTRAAAAARPSAPAAASGHGAPWRSSAQVAIPPIMNSPGMLKLRNFRMPMPSVKATATIA